MEKVTQTRDAEGKVKYSATIDQTSDVTVAPMSKGRATTLYLVYHKKLGARRILTRRRASTS